jgi:hypothetical protein
MSVSWADVRYWERRNDIFQYGYTVKPQLDGKFHAIIAKNGTITRDVPFGRRKVAKNHAYSWYEKRVEHLKMQQETANERWQLKERNKPKLTDTEKKINLLKAKIANAQKRQRELWKVMIQAERREQRAKKARMKWIRKEELWIKQLHELQPADLRTAAFVKAFKNIGEFNAT